jgi:ABC-type Fe3+ transport system permease subunit
VSKRSGDRLLWWVVGASAVITMLTVIGSRLIGPERPRAGTGQMLPRMRMPPAGTRQLWRALGIGSLTWYVCILSAPLFIWLSRRLPIDRERWRSSLAIHLLVIIGLVLATGAVQYRLSYGGSPMARWRHRLPTTSRWRC